MKTKIILFLVLALTGLNSLGQNNTFINQLLDRPIEITVINGDTFLQRDLTDYLNVSLGITGHPSGNIESDAHTNVDVLKDYFMRPHPSVSTIQKYFNQASNEFGVPVSLLMVIGQIENNWTQTGPTIDQGWGIMHLVKNNYCNTLEKAAKLIGVSEQVLKDDALQNIRGAAALIAKYAGKKRKKFNKLEDWFPALAKFSGLISPELREMQAKNYFETLNTGVKAQTVWGEEIIILPKKKSNNYQNKSNGNPPPMPLSPDYGPALTNWAASCNYATGRTYSIDTWVNHWIGTGTYLGTISWFQTCPCPDNPCASGPCPTPGYRECNRGPSSAHFVIKNSNGEITQMVLVANTAWHCGASGYPANNPRSIGVEHEATAANPGQWNSVPMLNASATMSCYFQQQYGFPTTQNVSPGICGHNDMPGTSTTCPGPLPWSTWMSYFNTACSVALPSNDDCSSSSAISLTSNTTCVNTSGDIAGATSSGITIPTCDGWTSSSALDVWYKFIAPATSVTITVTPSNGMDAVIAAYSSCSSSNFIDCNDDGGGAGGVEILNLSGLIVNNTYYLRVYEYGNPGTTTAFDICVTHTCTPPSTPTITPSGSTTFCAGVSVTLTSSSCTGCSYSWSNGANTQSITVSNSGNYTVTVSNGCSPDATSSPTIVTVNPVPSANPSSTNATCGNNDGSVSANANGGTPSYTYSWNNGCNTSTCNNLGAGTYTVTVTDANGCTTTGSATVGNIGGPSVNPSSTDATCGNNDGSVSANANGGTPSYTYSWNNGCNTATCNNLGAGTYTVTVTDANGCTTTGSATVENIGGPSVNPSSTDATCGNNDGSVSANANGGTPSYTYSWSNGCNTATCNNLGAGTYTVTVTDANGCTTTGSATVGNIGGPNVTTSVTNDSQGPPNCNGTATATPTGGTPPYTYLWSNGQTDSTATGLCAGTYNVTTTDNSGCTVIATVTVAQDNTGCTTSPPQPTIQVSGNTLTAYSVANVTYQWYFNNALIPGANSQSYSATTNGYYQVEVTDGNGCSTISDFTYCCSVGINENTLFGDIRIYPNPTPGKFTIEIALNKPQNMQIKIFNILGQDIFTEELKQISGTYTRQIDLSTQSPGIYSSQIITENGIINKKLIIQ